MEIDTRFIGYRSRTHTVTLTPRQCMNYAASVFDGNEYYFDDERPGGIVAPPMLAIALTWKMASDFTSYWESSDFPAEVLTRQVHYSEVLRWHRSMKPGDTLEIVGEVVSITPHRAGTYFIVRFTANDAQDGGLVFEEFIGGLLRDVKTVGEPQSREDIPEPPRYSEPARPEWEAVLPIDPLAAHLYDGAGDVHFPIHTSVAFAHSVGLPNIIYHGTATLAQALRELVNREAGGDPTRLLSVICLFTDMVFPGTHVALRLLGREETGDITRLYFQVLNDAGRKAVRRGCVELRMAD